MKDGQPFRYISGSMHYFRIHPRQWRDRLRKLRATGCNAVQVYVEWRTHMATQDGMCWRNFCDLTRFLRLAQEIGLYVILRPGPFIDAEREFGGMPAWLLTREPEMRVRSSDPRFIAEVDRWFSALFEKIKSFSYVENGGPIIMVQVENEYGSYGVQTDKCDVKYLAFLRDKILDAFGKDTFLFTTDGFTLDRIR